jgi:hypothetical protein
MGKAVNRYHFLADDELRDQIQAKPVHGLDLSPPHG